MTQNQSEALDRIILDKILCDLHDLNFHGENLAHLEKLAEYILESNSDSSLALLNRIEAKASKRLDWNTEEMKQFSTNSGDSVMYMGGYNQAVKDFEQLIKQERERL